MSEHDEGDKTEEPTPEKRKKARDEGQFARSKDAGAVVASVAVLAALVGMAPSVAGLVRELTQNCLRNPHAFIGGDIRSIVQQALTTLAILCVPVGVIAAIAGTAIGFAEAGFHPNTDLVMPKFERLDPISKLGQLFSPKSGTVNVVLSLARVGVVGWVAYSVVSEAFPRLTRLSRIPLATGVTQALEVTLRVAMWATLALAILAAADYAQSWFKTEKQLKMSREELKEEMKQQDGNPQIKARQRAKAREILRRGIAKEVKSSDVVIANPTHVAVAIRYRPEEGAPIVAAKGYDEVALYIKKLAAENNIPIVENRPLARALAEKVKQGRSIPVDLYAAVAEVLAFVYRLKHRRRRA